MNTMDFKSLSKTFSNEILFDSICNRKIWAEELEIYWQEVKNRGLEKEMSEMIAKNENRKNQIISSVKEVSNESLFSIVIYNIDNFTF